VTGVHQPDAALVDLHGIDSTSVLREIRAADPCCPES